jgi:hypothetical protein
MSEAVIVQNAGARRFAGGALKAAALFWFVVAVIGQWAFAAYTAVRYGPTVNGNFADWNRDSSLIDGYIAGDLVGNLTFLVHVLLAAVLTLGGALQLFPQIRARAIGLHRWNGRLFMATALLATVGGLYLIWVRGTGGGAFDPWAITANAALIILFIALAWFAVRRKDIATHQRWAMRAYLAVNGVWFLRVGLMAYAIITRSERSLEGFFDIWSWGSFLVPLAAYEAYLFAKERGGATAKLATSAGLFALTLLMAVGVAGAIGLMWLPRIT